MYNRPLETKTLRYMHILVNGEAREVADSYTAAQLIDDMNLAGKRIAMEVNMEIVPRSSFAEHTFNEGDKVEIVMAIGGG